MPDQSRRQIASSAIDEYQKGLSRGQNARDAYHRALLSVSSSLPSQSRAEAYQTGQKAISTYAEKLVTMSPVDAKTAAVSAFQDHAKARGGGLDVGSYAGAIMDSYNRTRANGKEIVYAHAGAAASKGKADLRSAVTVADRTLREYSNLRTKGVDHQSARAQVVQEMTRQFDSNGQYKQQHDRQRSGSMEL